MTAEFEKVSVSVTYIDENGVEQTANAILLDGDVKLILGDGCTLDVTTNSDYSSVWQKSGTDKAFTVY